MGYKKITALLAASALLLSGCSGLSAKRDQVYTDTLFDTVVNIRIYDAADESVLKGCEELCKKYDAMFSRTNENSEISMINNAGGAAVEVSKETIKLIQKGIYYSEMSNGAFDITIGSVSALWDFKSDAPAVPDAAAIAEAVSHVNYKNILIRDNTVRLLDPQAKLDVGAIAKGYIADRVRDYLEEEGIDHAMIDLGGNIVAMGSKPDGTDYNIGIQKPFDESGTPITSVKLSNKSIVTSGIYQRYFEADGVLYHHILDTATGYPCDNDLASVTIINDSSVDGDALSTTCFAMGLTDGLAFAESLPNTEAIFITTDGELHCTSGIGTSIPFRSL